MFITLSHYTKKCKSTKKRTLYPLQPHHRLYMVRMWEHINRDNICESVEWRRSRSLRRSVIRASPKERSEVAHEGRWITTDIYDFVRSKRHDRRQGARVHAISRRVDHERVRARLARDKLSEKLLCWEIYRDKSSYIRSTFVFSSQSSSDPSFISHNK